MKTVAKLGFTLLMAFCASAFADDKLSPPPEMQAVTQNAINLEKNTASNPSEQLNKVNINSASAAEIQDKLVGIGEKKAQAIVDHRTKYGAFSTVEQLTDVSGIGKATLEKNRERILLE